jgi:hypothetical protein
MTPIYAQSTRNPSVFCINAALLLTFISHLPFTSSPFGLFRILKIFKLVAYDSKGSQAKRRKETTFGDRPALEMLSSISKEAGSLSAFFGGGEGC